jgi:hypothetical protein
MFALLSRIERSLSSENVARFAHHRKHHFKKTSSGMKISFMVSPCGACTQSTCLANRPFLEMPPGVGGAVF